MAVSHPPPATPERRPQSIAAALDAATAAPKITSLAPVRQARVERRRQPNRWFAAVAAAVVALIAIPIIGSIGGDDAVDTAAELSSDTDATDSRSLGGDLSGGDNGGDDGSDESMAAADAVPESDIAPAEAADAIDGAADMASDGDDSAVTSADADTATTTTAPSASERSIPVATGPEELASFLDDGTIAPQFVIDDPLIVENVSVECLEPFAEVLTQSFGLARLLPADGSEKIVLVYFDDSGEISTLDGEDCSSVG